jgi:arginine-tRNA-protein transferase
MSIIKPANRPLQVFFRSAPIPCPYLPDRQESKLFTRLVPASGADVNSALSQAGFRRSHDIVYRPVCPDCAACVPVRVPVARFAARRTLARIRRRNADLALRLVPAHPTLEQYRLFHAYQQSRHGDGEMARMSLADYCAMVEEGRADTVIVEARDAAGRLVAAMLTDRLADGLSAVYCFFDPAETDRSLGTFMIVCLIETAQALERPYVYLGYFIAGSRKMAYKARFRPLEALTPRGWEPVDEAAFPAG